MNETYDKKHKIQRDMQKKYTPIRSDDRASAMPDTGRSGLLTMSTSASHALLSSVAVASLPGDDWFPGDDWSAFAV
jgi:hypothetical protein